MWACAWGCVLLIVWTVADAAGLAQPAASWMRTQLKKLLPHIKRAAAASLDTLISCLMLLKKRILSTHGDQNRHGHRAEPSHTRSPAPPSAARDGGGALQLGEDADAESDAEEGGEKRCANLSDLNATASAKATSGAQSAREDEDGGMHLCSAAEQERACEGSDVAYVVAALPQHQRAECSSEGATFATEKDGTTEAESGCIGKELIVEDKASTRLEPRPPQRKSMVQRARKLLMPIGRNRRGLHKATMQ
uniref:Uncharacterized protein n=1 Tax=Calcidiscus leptoporus TaxID=127549 RepID=A0A7S0IQR5_9EUKA